MAQNIYIILRNEGCGEDTVPSQSAYPTEQEAKTAAIQNLKSSLSEHLDSSSQAFKNLIKLAQQDLNSDDTAHCVIDGFELHLSIYAIQVPWLTDESSTDRSMGMSDQQVIRHILNTQGIVKLNAGKLYPKNFLLGFLDYEHDNTGHCLLRSMGYDGVTVPFNIKDFLITGKTSFIDPHGNYVSLSFKVKEDEAVCHVSYGDKKKSSTIDFEDREDYTPAAWQKLLSQLIGEDCATNLDEIFPYDQYPNPDFDDE